MKKFINKILIFAAAFLGFLGLGAPLLASAEEIPVIEEVIETPVIDVENDEKMDDTLADDETPAQTEKEEITVEDTTFEDFLAWAGEQAEQYGYGDEFKAATDALKTAATTKQVTLSTVASAVLAALVLGVVISNKIKEGKVKQAIVELSQKLDNQVDGTNALIDGTNEGNKTGEKTEKEVLKANAEIASLKKTLSLFIGAFMRFTDGVKLQTSKKEEVRTNLLNALKEVEGGAENGERKV